MSAPSEPVVGICAVREPASWAFWHQLAHLVADTYVGSVQRSGAIAVLLPVDVRRPVEVLDRVDGLLLIGGADLDPAVYGATRDAATEATYRDRDEFEIALLRGALKRGMPVLGICRGMQLINVALGGSLDQDLVTPDGDHPHRKVVGSFEGTDHFVKLEPGTLASESAAEEFTLARCHHHQAVSQLGEGLVVSGRADDGVIEAIEAADGRWLLGVQWHPETDERSRLFSALRGAAILYAAGKDAQPSLANEGLG
jgi:gamma-glutamyl-gamma-aminobutyrate hydrolase PuuD